LNIITINKFYHIFKPDDFTKNDNTKVARVVNKKFAIKIRNKEEDTNSVLDVGLVNGPK
jgi:hypothetical protein